jgi:hypothetical protein
MIASKSLKSMRAYYNLPVPMFLLLRLTSASCRSLAAMIGCALGGHRRGRGGQSGSPDDASLATVPVALRRVLLLVNFLRSDP